MMLNPLHYLRQRRRMEREVEAEVQFLRRAYGEGAYQAALDKLQRPDLTQWGRKIMRATAKRLSRNKPKPAPARRSRRPRTG